MWAHCGGRILIRSGRRCQARSQGGSPPSRPKDPERRKRQLQLLASLDPAGGATDGPCIAAARLIPPLGRLVHASVRLADGPLWALDKTSASVNGMHTPLAGAQSHAITDASKTAQTTLLA